MCRGKFTPKSPSNKCCGPVCSAQLKSRQRRLQRRNNAGGRMVLDQKTVREIEEKYIDADSPASMKKLSRLYDMSPQMIRRTLVERGVRIRKAGEARKVAARRTIS